MVKLQDIYLKRKNTRHRSDQLIRRSETTDNGIKGKIVNKSPKKVVFLAIHNKLQILH